MSLRREERRRCPLGSIQFGLDSVTDIQSFSRTHRLLGDEEYVRGLDKCVQRDLRLGFRELNRWIRIKKDIQRLMSANIFATSADGSQDNFNNASTTSHICQACVISTKNVSRATGSLRSWRRARVGSRRPILLTTTLGRWRRRLGRGARGRRRGDQHWTSSLTSWKIRESRILRKICTGYNDGVGYYDDYSDGGCCTAADGALFPEYFDGCWDKGS
jgi:hypothetical protein